MTEDFVPYAVEPPVVELREISKQYGDVRAVDRLTLSIQQGEFITLLGPSGCGKTTTLRMIGGFECPAAGAIYINGELMGSRPPHKRPVNTVFQNYALFPHMTVAQNIGYGLETAGAGKKERQSRVEEALELVRLPHIEKRKPAELSGGQQQRVALARALVNKPKVLLLDEPLGALDLKLRKAMQLELKALNREVGVTFVYVTHDQEEALAMSDRIAVMNQGRILQLGNPEEIYERPNSVFVADFVGQTNLLQGRVVRAAGDFAEVELSGAGLIRARLSRASRTSEQVTVTVRPEHVAFSGDFGEDGAPAGWNSVSGVVREVIYVGTHRQYVVELSAQASLLVRQQYRARGSSDGRPGQIVTLVFDPGTATVLTG